MGERCPESQVLLLGGSACWGPFGPLTDAAAGGKYGTSWWCELCLSRENVGSHLLVMLKQMCCGDAFKFTWFENWRRERNSFLELAA